MTREESYYARRRRLTRNRRIEVATPIRVPTERLFQELGTLTMKVAILEEQVAQLQQQNANLAKQLREVLEENAKLKQVPHAEPPAEEPQSQTAN